MTDRPSTSRTNLDDLLGFKGTAPAGCTIVECGVAETRSAFLIGSKVLKFWFGPARGDENDPTLGYRPSRGDDYVGRVRSVSKPLNGAFVDIGVDRDGFLPLKRNQKPPVEGALIFVTVRRPEIGGKGAVLTVDEPILDGVEFDPNIDPYTGEPWKPGGIGEMQDVAITASQIGICAKGGRFVNTVINDAIAAIELRDSWLSGAGIDDDPFETYGADEALEAALERQVLLPSGVRLTFDETEGPTVVDVDAGSAADGATGRLNDKVNLAAAKALPAELCRRAIGGRVVVDFLPPSGGIARRALIDAVKDECRDLINLRIGKLSADGLLDITLPREGYSLLEQASEPVSGDDFARAGRRFTLDWQAKAAIRALEKRLAAAPSARLKLFAGGEICDYLEGRAQWTERLAAKFGARFEVLRNEKLKERTFDIAE